MSRVRAAMWSAVAVALFGAGISGCARSGSAAVGKAAEGGAVATLERAEAMQRIVERTAAPELACR
jgi:hypothetical protein